MCALVFACSNNPESEYPDEDDDLSSDDQDSHYSASKEETSETSDRVPPPGQWTEEDTARYTPQPSAEEPEESEWKSRTPVDSAETNDEGLRNFLGNAHQSGDVLFALPPFWMVKESDAGSVKLHSPQMQATIQIIGGPPGKGSVNAAADMLRSSFEKDGMQAGPAVPRPHGMRFSLASAGGGEMAGEVVVMLLDHSAGNRVVAVLGIWPSLSHGAEAMMEVVDSIELED
jgi:hypothetical protein